MNKKLLEGDLDITLRKQIEQKKRGNKMVYLHTDLQ